MYQCEVHQILMKHQILPSTCENMSQQIIVQKCILYMNKMYELALSRPLELLYFMIIGIGKRGSNNVTL